MNMNTKPLSVSSETWEHVTVRARPLSSARLEDCDLRLLWRQVKMPSEQRWDAFNVTEEGQKTFVRVRSRSPYQTEEEEEKRSGLGCRLNVFSYYVLKFQLRQKGFLATNNLCSCWRKQLCLISQHVYNTAAQNTASPLISITTPLQT